MPLKRTRRAPKRAPKRRRFAPKRTQRKAPMMRNVRETGNYASVEETWIQNNVQGVCGDLKVQGLLGNGATYRAPLVAKAYQEYRITGIEVRIIPTKDTFLSSGTDIVPTLYWMNDPMNALLNNMVEADFQALGAKPIRLDDKIIRRSLKPNVIVVAAPQGTGFPSIAKRSPWLSTNSAFTPVTAWSPSTVTHYGAKWFITPTIATAPVYEIQVKATYQFRRPLLGANTSAPAPQ